MSYENISINIDTVEEALEKMRQTYENTATDCKKLIELDTSGEGLTAQEHQQIQTLSQIANYEFQIMDSLIRLVADTLAAYVTTDDNLRRRIAKALNGQ